MQRTALVLSGGAFFGAYQAGAWSALEGEIHPDLIVGTSVGALNGWAIAGGIAPQELIADWRHPSVASMLTRRTRFPTPFGMFDQAALACKVKDLVSHYQPRIPIGITVVQVPGLKSRLFMDKEITERHLLASCAIPVGFAPVVIDGKLYVDGGIISSLPLWAAVQMGATRIVAINVLPVLPSRVLKLLGGTIRLVGPRPKPVPDCVEVIRIVPAASLGTLNHSAEWNAARIEQWIEAGRRDALAILSRGRGRIVEVA